jgi:hypothetical protein
MRILSDIRKGENIDLYFFAFAALTLAGLNGLGLAPKTLVESVTLALLGILAVYSLGIRDRLTNLSDKLSGTTNILYKEFPSSLKDTISNSQELLIVGVTLYRTISTFYPDLEEKLKKGHKIKVLLVEPNTESTKLLPSRIYRPTSDRVLSDKILETIQFLLKLKATAPDKVEIKTINFPVAFGCFASNIDFKDGSIHIEYYSFKTTSALPCAIVSSRNDPYWYEVYKKEVENLWNAASDWNTNP